MSCLKINFNTICCFKMGGLETPVTITDILIKEVGCVPCFASAGSAVWLTDRISLTRRNSGFYYGLVHRDVEKRRYAPFCLVDYFFSEFHKRDCREWQSGSCSSC